ncbi:MAG: ribonuclease II [Candidatus Dactylopiibacterium carminicum]|uniref:RNB domain-containing ribonuclease n=1 Tax=Candidatus Dactylopiibacterium carminicum TaxID=857335 RepID=A0A272EWR1_9RHOO|nr:RNB domain-containing ribonuclease [Candidatus Dactylopiibacterium carminicum]KAF7600057.1 RNB domain-containing ribonuclease [Candidatus Dactylopiibacterium carminicum]PAS94553.1 MAG: ribonuclease II [Candidatus Dactylopiibacterium carminicum]PAS97592.1 MAG: ribonuclease II [Candidatus Dactylopiibacterium carminicum]PAT00059.1 MAG: ribonuclease II [Candidatus Dactylopiibacterium carminicum]
MNVLFEEDGAFKTGSILADNDSSLQVETSTGKRVKLKAANVLLRFNALAAGELIPRAEAEAEGMETDFLWEMCGEDEFAFTDFASEYFGHAPSAMEATAVLLKLFASPIHFHRKGRGRFRKAPPEILAAALAGAEKKRLQQEQVERMKTELVSGTLPAEFAPMLQQLLYKPDRNRLEAKALEAAEAESGLSAARLLLKAGALGSSHELHLGRFLFEYFPDGTEFPALPIPALSENLPTANVRAFSIDDASTTEIDDAFSLAPRAAGGWTIGIHIAAPGLGIRPGCPIDAVARRRLSTVYMPGNKITMLPDAVVAAYTLGEGQARPALSLYVEVNADYSIAGHYSRIERVPVAANLRHHDIEPLFNEASLETGLPDAPWMRELQTLWEFATVLEAGRGKPSANQNQLDFNFSVDWTLQSPDGPGVVCIEQRRRGSPLDKLVAELMILVNSTWGRLLLDAGLPAIYRIQAGGRVRMSTAAGPHEGLGVDNYAWSSSPLRRYVDLCNQWQLISLLRGEEAIFPAGGAELGAAMNDFDVTYNAYNEFQRHMERYWCLRWLRQDGLHETSARVLRENILRCEAVPLVFKLHSLPASVASGERVQLAIERIDLIDLELRGKYLASLPPLATPTDGTDGEEETGPLT